MQKLFLCLLLVCLLATATVAQITTAEILGTVRDASGATVAGAGVKVRNLGTNDTRELMTSGEGRFRATQLQPGSYEVTISKTGFGT